MKVYPEKNKIIEAKNKMKYFILNSSKTPDTQKKRTKFISNNKNDSLINQTLSVKNKISQLNFKTIINTNNKKLIINRYSKNIPHIKNYFSSGSSVENEPIKKQNIVKIKDFKKNFTKNFFTNVYDINNNNYFVNLYDSSTSIPQKYKSKNSVINKNFYNKINSRNQDIKDYSFNKANKTNIYEASITEPDNYNRSLYINTSETKEMLKNYRNKLLKEFMKYLKKFYVKYYKKYFIFFINELKLMKNKRRLKQFVYSKKIQKKPNTFKKLSFVETIISKRRTEKNRILLNNLNQNSLNLTDRKIESKSIVSKIINNQSKELLDGKIRNIFLDTSFLNETNSIEVDNNIYYNKTSSSIENNHSFRGNRHRIFLGDIISKTPKEKNNNCREIKLNINQIEQLKKEKIKKLSFDNKINLRFNYIELKNNKTKNCYRRNINMVCISKLESFSIICKNEKKAKFYGRKKYFNLLKNKKFLSSIKEEDEKFSLSIQDSITPENTKIYVKENIQYIQNKNRFKALINDFLKEKYNKVLLYKLKDFANVYNKMNKK